MEFDRRGSGVPRSVSASNTLGWTVGTMMSSLPPEILGSIFDHLHDNSATLKTCCIVPKSWVHRTRRHLFAHIQFCPSLSPTELWKKTFPDPSNSPAHYTRSLSIIGTSGITAARLVGFPPFTTSYTWRCRMWIGPPSSCHTDYRPPSDHSA